MESKGVSYSNVLINSYDVPTESLKVNIVGGGSPSMPNIVQLSNGSTLLTTTSDTGKVALDVNIINGISVSIDHTEDSIRLGNGTDYLTTTTVGSKVALDVELIKSAVAGLPTVYNVSMPSASTEYSFLFPIGTKKFTIKTRITSVLQYTFQVGQSNTTFVTLPSGTNYSEDSMSLTSALNIYFRSNKPSNTLEITVWT